MRNWLSKTLFLTAILVSFGPRLVQAEILAMLNYESKPGTTDRKEGIAVIDVDPDSPRFNTIVQNVPLPPDLVAHHIFYNHDRSKAYVTSLGRSEMYVFPMSSFPEGKTVVSVPDCKVGEDLVFTDDGKLWFLSCMGSSNVIVGDAIADQPLKEIAAAPPASPFIQYPHGITLHEGINRLFVTSTIRPSDMKEPGDTITVIDAKRQVALSTHRMSNKASPAASAPVEIAFVPGSQPPRLYVANMLEGTVWTGLWNGEKQNFSFQQAFDFAPLQQGVPLEFYFSKGGDRMYLTTAKPGHLNIFDIATDPSQPKLLERIPTAAGAHHVAFSPDGHYAFVQNSLLNLPDMNDGDITIVDLQKSKAIAHADILKKSGYNPNCILLLPQWHRQDHHS